MRILGSKQTISMSWNKCNINKNIKSLKSWPVWWDDQGSRSMRWKSLSVYPAPEGYLGRPPYWGREATCNNYILQKLHIPGYQETYPTPLNRTGLSVGLPTIVGALRRFSGSATISVCWKKKKVTFNDTWQSFKNYLVWMSRQLKSTVLKGYFVKKWHSCYRLLFLDWLQTSFRVFFFSCWT